MKIDARQSERGRQHGRCGRAVRANVLPSSISSASNRPGPQLLNTRRADASSICSNWVKGLRSGARACSRDRSGSTCRRATPRRRPAELPHLQAERELRGRTQSLPDATESNAGDRFMEPEPAAPERFASERVGSKDPPPLFPQLLRMAVNVLIELARRCWPAIEPDRNQKKRPEDSGETSPGLLVSC